MCPLIQPHTSIVITMARLGFALRWLPCQVRRRYRRSMEWCYLLYFTLFFNYFTTWMIVFETALEPMFWFVDKFAKCLGPIFVTLVVFMTTSVVTIFYVCLLPHVYSYSVGWTVFHLIFGHWLLINIVFHYIMAVFTQPGNPPKKNVPEIVSICKKCISPKPPNFLQNVPEIVSICKKCISPKPPRTHHCTVCGKCILKMDHHCPWLNNCVGHYNHRYFFLFCVYMWLGTIYVSWVGHELFRQHFYGDKPTAFPPTFYPLNIVYDSIYKDKDVKPMMAETESNITTNYIEHYYHVAVLYEFILCSGVTLALGLLMLWHAKLISSGETSIEVHINRKQEARYKKKNLVYKNPYNYGFKKNWQEFLGINGGRSFIRHVLLPSSHDPEGNGLTWSRALYKVSETNGFQAS